MKKATKTRHKKPPPRTRKTSASRPQRPAGGRRAAAVVEAPKRLSPQDRRSQLLDVAKALFTDRDYDEIGMPDVARAAGITQGLVYHYFENKDALFQAALEASAAELLRACLPDPTLPVPQQFEVGVKGYLDYVEAHRVAYLNIFRGPSTRTPGFERIVEDTRHAITDHIVRQLGLADAAIPVTRLSLRGYLGFFEYVVLDWLEHRSVPRAALERLVFAMVLTTLRSGFEGDRDIPLTASALAEFVRSYKRHFRQ